MFGGSRRRKSPAQPLTRETANPNAATAAAAVFMSRRDSNSSLSSAAAAAALRARPMTPTNVAEVQSKRAHRRSPSFTSVTGSVRGRRELSRTPSVGSMVERTFRTPSPGRSPVPRERDVPPVPAMPSVDHVMASHQTNGHTKATPLQTQPFRTASQKMKAAKGNQASWFGGAIAQESASARTADAVLQSTGQIPEARPGSVSPSINFSYPRNRALSPTPSIDDQTLVYDPNSRRMMPRSELVGHTQHEREISPKPKKKKKQAGINRAGSHLAKGSVGSRTVAPGLKNTESKPEPEPEPAPEPAAEVLMEPAVAPESTAFASTAPVSAPVAVQDELQDSPSKKKNKKKKKKNQKKRSAEVQPQGAATELQDEGDEPSMEKTSGVKEDEGGREEVDKQKSKQGEEDPATAVVPVVASPATQSHPTKLFKSADITHPAKKIAVRQSRIHSESPVRSARFATTSSPDQMAVRHEPPARSVSPRKSAMKLSSPGRGVSPSDDGSESSAARGPNLPDDSSLSRKKSARVSWDDRNTVVVGEGAQPVEESDSPVVPSPQTRRSWHSVMTKFTKKDSAVELAEDETMTPRPALPQFGSIREKKMKEPEERPLVRPSDRVFSSENGSAMTGLGQSADALIGAAISQDLATRNSANISRFREPLPADMSSATHSQDHNIEAGSDDDDLDTDATTESEDNSASLSAKPSKPTAAEATAPTVLVSSSTSDKGGPVAGAPPGGFPEDDNVSTDKSLEEDSDDSGTSTPTRTVEPTSAGNVGMLDVVVEDEEMEPDRFSDAYEELDEVEGDGFLSLDAVVESPTVNSVTPRIAREQPVMLLGRDGGSHQKATPGIVDKGESPSDWENAKAYWKSLSIEKRRQLEIEALSETGEDVSAAGEQDVTPVVPDTATATPSVDSERLYQIKPGTKWSGEEGDSHDEGKGQDAVAATCASALATPPKTTVQNAPKLRQSLRQSLRTDQPTPTRDTGLDNSVGMRRTMRNGPTSVKNATTAVKPKVGMRQSLRESRPSENSPGPALSASDRPSAVVNGHKGNMLSPDPSALLMRPALDRRGSDDSESSFKRKRPVSQGDSRPFRMSMRASVRETPSPNEPAKRFSLRSLSPPALRRNSFSSLPPGTPSTASGAGSGRMRQSLRDRPTSSSGGSRMKLGSFRKPAAFGKKSHGGSRFADSSDEEDDGPTLFRSRFADSSDEEEAAPFPSRSGLPKSLRNTAPRDVNDPTASRSVDDNQATTGPNHDSLANGQSSLQRSRSGRDTLDPSMQNDMPRSSIRRGSFMSILRRKKDHSGKVVKDIGESGARKDTKLERSAGELAELRGQNNGPSWPLANAAIADSEVQRPKTAEPERPSTSGGPSAPKRSGFMRRRSTSDGMVGLQPLQSDPTDPVPAVPDAYSQEPAAFGQSQPPIRKKKFGALRKMFGIHD